MAILCSLFCFFNQKQEKILIVAIEDSFLMMNKVVLVIGQTGTGKSKLAVDLAKQFNGEIINADSIQIYNVSKKKTITEQALISKVPSLSLLVFRYR